MNVIRNGLLGLMVVALGTNELRPVWPVVIPSVKPRLTGSCWAGGLQVDRPLVVWVEHTLADTGGFARQNRAGSGLPEAPGLSAAVVTADSVCAALAYRFAKAVDGRDTMNIAPVHAVKVDTSYFVVTDYKPRAEPDVSVSGGVVHFSGRPQWTDAVTFDASMDVVGVWKYVYSSHYGSPYER